MLAASIIQANHQGKNDSQSRGRKAKPQIYIYLQLFRSTNHVSGTPAYLYRKFSLFKYALYFTPTCRLGRAEAHAIAPSGPTEALTRVTAKPQYTTCTFSAVIPHKLPHQSLTSLRNRALSIRSKKGGSSETGSSGSSHRVGFSFSSLRGSIQPELSRKLYKLIKTTNNLITAHETAGRERAGIASQLSEWGEQTEDEAISDVSDKVGVIMSEMGEQEDLYAHAVDDSRGILKQIRDTEKSVQPSRDGKRKIADEIAKLKSKEPESTRLVTLEQELVRAEAENLVAEAQLTNIVSRDLLH